MAKTRREQLSMTQPSNGTSRIYVASFNGGKSEGIWRCLLNSQSGTLQLEKGFREGAQNPLYVATDPQQRFLFVADYVEPGDGQTGAISSYAMDRATGCLKFLSRKPSEGTIPCYLSVSANSQFVLVANYGDGSVAVLRLGSQGELGEVVSVQHHVAPAATPARQAHAHSIVLDAANRFAFVGELGLDQVIIYRFDAATGKLTPSGSWSARNQAGPRHFRFHPDGRHAYLINELDSTVVAFDYDASKGTLTELQTLSTLPKGYQGKNDCADLHVHGNGRFLYGSNRGHDSLAIFRIEAGTGRMEIVGHQSTEGNCPRSFAIDPSGAILAVGNKKSDSLVTFRIDQQQGTLTATKQTLGVPAPACITFVTGTA